MTEETANQIAGRGFNLFMEQRYEEASALYEEAIAKGLLAGHWTERSIHGEYGGVLSGLGDHRKTRQQLEHCLALELRHAADETDIAVVVARYFLGNHLNRMNDPAEALRIVAPTIEALGARARLAFTVKAKALEQLGRVGEARQAALDALEASQNEDARRNTREFLEGLLHDHP